MNRLLLKLCCVMLFVFTATNVSAASLVLNANDKLAGINGINVEGFGLYDVTFNNTFDYSLGGNSYSFVAAATSALYSAFNGDGFLADTIYDKKPWLTEGCETPNSSCDMLTIYVHSNGFDTGSYFYFRNTDRFEYEQEGIGYGQGNLYPAERSFAIWSESSLVATPVPSAALLFAPALLGAISFRRKFKFTTSDEQNISI